MTQVFGAITFYAENQPAISTYQNASKKRRFDPERGTRHHFLKTCAGASPPRVNTSIPDTRNR